MFNFKGHRGGHSVRNVYGLGDDAIVPATAPAVGVVTPDTATTTVTPADVQVAAVVQDAQVAAQVAAQTSDVAQSAALTAQVAQNKADAAASQAASAQVVANAAANEAQVKNDQVQQLIAPSMLDGLSWYHYVAGAAALYWYMGKGGSRKTIKRHSRRRR